MATADSGPGVRASNSATPYANLTYNCAPHARLLDQRLEPHVRILRHYIHTPFLFMALGDLAIVVAAAWLGYLTQYWTLPEVATYLPSALAFAVLIVISMAAMNVYEARMREGFSGVMLRTAVAIFLLGTLGMAAASYALPFTAMESRSVLLYSSIEAFALVAGLRWLTGTLISEDALKKRVVVLGTGARAAKIASRMRRRSDRRGFVLIGFVDMGGDDEISAYGARVIRTTETIKDYCLENRIDEIVVAMDDRRRRDDDAALAGLPLDHLLECRLSGIEVCEIQEFVEREASRLDVDLLQPYWLVFADGFISSPGRTVSKRLFDLVAASSLLLVALPVVALAVFVLWLMQLRGKGSVIYRQQRVGLDGATFNLLKLRSMAPSEDETYEEFTSLSDPRITRFGAFIRKTRIDELPQLINVLRGDMSFVGPRPERPGHVRTFEEHIPYYGQRHRIKPGITGWAQLCYPYGASIEDAKEKLQYDLYYLKNHSLLLDLIILVQTVEVVLVGEGAR
jgi:sugar transferase (PEP-CTERM system associated)